MFPFEKYFTNRFYYLFMNPTQVNIVYENEYPVA